MQRLINISKFKSEIMKKITNVVLFPMSRFFDNYFSHQSVGAGARSVHLSYNWIKETEKLELSDLFRGIIYSNSSKLLSSTVFIDYNKLSLTKCSELKDDDIKIQ